MKYTHATAVLAGTLAALGTATPAFAHHDASHDQSKAVRVAEAQAQIDAVHADQMKQLTEVATPQKFLGDVKAKVDDLQLKEESAARKVHPGGPNAVPAPGALLGGLAAGGGPVGVPLDSLG
ncbi:hypothetical protein ACIO3O_23965 [Streptomyces sp. NPDC087440]|uniref:hypothetical protein n=1 Tax=Streptomyces sp. NPDC087440 TaxID=3365790 RepID=UPI003818849A